MTEVKVLRLHFMDQNGHQSTITIKNPKDNLTLETVKEVMGRMLTYQVFEGSSGILQSFKKAEYITTATEPLA